MQPEETSADYWFTPKEYATALRRLSGTITGQQRKMLKAHAEAPGLLLSVSELAEVAGQSTDDFTYSVYGRLGHLLANELEPEVDTEPGPKPIWTRYIGEDIRLTDDAPVS